MAIARRMNAERVKMARDFVKQWESLERKQCSAVEWLQLKFSVTASQAQALYDAAMQATPTTAPAKRVRGYSRAFTARGDTGKSYALVGIPAGLWKDVKAKSKRSGVSVR